MGYIEENLTQSERLICKVHRHWISWAIPELLAGLFIVAMIIGAIAILVSGTGAGGGAVAFLPPFIIAVPLLLWGLHRRYGFEFAVTNKRVIYRKGILALASEDMFLNKIESVLVHQSLLGRWIGYGNITFRGTGGSWEPFKSIPEPLRIRQLVQNEITATNLAAHA